MSATPRKTEKSTTAGTTLLDSAVERIGRNKQIDEVKRPALFDQRGAEKRCGLDVGKGQRNKKRESQRDGPQADENRSGAEPECFHLIVTERPQTRDNRERNIRQHGHLQQLDETVRRDS